MGNQANTQIYQNGILLLQAQAVDYTPYLAQRLILLADSGAALTADINTLMSYRNSDGGWGGYLNYGSANFHTSLALQALKAVNYSDTTVISSALAYLAGTQNTDGGWGFYQGDDSNVYMTALVLQTLSQFSTTYNLSTAINKAASYLIANQNSDGGFGSPSSTVYETSHAYMALAGLITDNTVLGNAINYLSSTQAPNGSWNDDPYSTALALRALYLSENKPTPPPSPTTGTVTGVVVEASTNQPLGGVSISAVGGQLSATTDNTGSFTLANMPAGSQQITLSLSGYAS